jgi:uncharacterized protein (TIGR02145 family)
MKNVKSVTRLFSVFAIGLFISFCGNKSTDNDNEIGTVTDIDGNVYHTVTIGSQEWMAENLKVTHYRNGDTIPNVTDALAWDALSTGAYCEYENSVDSATIYGRLYNWYAANDSRIIAPDGWHIPSLTEWTTLQNYLGSDAGSKMKEIGTAHWISPNTGATNESGFNGLPAGGRGYQGAFIGLHRYTWFCSSTESDSDHVWLSNLNHLDTYLNLVSHPLKTGGYSIRCVKD